jgi:hypothetical protein
MKFKITYKTPDAVEYALRDARIEPGSDEWDEQEEALLHILGSSEYLTVEVDTETGTVEVVKRK